MNDDVLVRVEGVSKKFCRSLKKSLWYGMQDLGNELRGRRHGGDGELRPDEFWAVKDVSFELRRGECLGLIGRNGAGKTTLLRMLNGLIKPDRGRIEMRGRVGALIALGAGFNPVLTGRENIYVNATVLGLNKQEINKKMTEIIEFSELKEYIDSPVQYYSSGMIVRLGFAVAASINPDILLIDEVLAVGDIKFRSQCYNKIKKIRDNSTIIVVSHHKSDLSRVCNIGAFLNNGNQVFLGDLPQAIRAYEETISRNYQKLTFQDDLCQLVSLTIFPLKIKMGDYINVRAEINFAVPEDNVFYRISIVDESENCVAEWRSDNYYQPKNESGFVSVLFNKIGPIKLASGLYHLNFIVSTRNKEYAILKYSAEKLLVESSCIGLSRYQI